MKNPFRYRGYYYDAETGFYYLGSRYYDPEVGRFINADEVDLLFTNLKEFTDKNLYAYCDNNPVMRVDKDGNIWELALASGGTMALGSGSAIVAGLSATVPIAVAVIVTVIVVVSISAVVKYTKDKSDKESGTKDRTTSPIGRRNTYNSRKRAEEAAKKAGGGKKPVKHPKGFHGNKRPHYHPNVKNNYRITPHGPSCHDHYFYPR